MAQVPQGGTRGSRRCAVLGKPIAHSLSPVLHEAAYRALGLDGWTYGRVEAGEDDLAPFLATLDGTWAGLSLTMPLKRTIQPYGHPANLWARELGVANTAVFSDGGVKLYNTDVYGIARAFAHARGETAPHIDDAVILGNGNTATSALAACIMMGIRDVTVAARHPERNPGLAELGARHGIQVSMLPLASDGTIVRLETAGIAISTIPGHGADDVAARLDAADARVHGMLLDVVYDPRPTALMRAWSHLGGIALGGEEMLLYQAVAQVLLMTGRAHDDAFDQVGAQATHEALETAMRAALEEAL